MSQYNYDEDEEEDGTIVMLGAAAAALAVASYLLEHNERHYNKTPFHDSALSGAAWVLELLNGHPECIRLALGVHKHVFRALVKSLKDAGYVQSKYLTIEEQLAIFLYTCVTGLSINHVSERFQWTPEMTSK